MPTNNTLLAIFVKMNNVIDIALHGYQISFDRIHESLSLICLTRQADMFSHQARYGDTVTGFLRCTEQIRTRKRTKLTSVLTIAALLR